MTFRSASITGEGEGHTMVGADKVMISDKVALELDVQLVAP